MKTLAGVAFAPRQGIEVVELELDPPRAGEVLVKWVASGLCHSDYHFVTGDAQAPGPIILGHEGAGIVQEVGPYVTKVKPGDHFVACFIPACGHCRWCSTGHQNLCDMGFAAEVGALMDGTFRFHYEGRDLGALCRLGTFSQYSVISEHSLVKIDDDIPLEPACLVGCGVPTGWGSAVIAADIEPGDTVVIFGTGGVGMNAVQGAAFAGARYVVAVDPAPFKREKALEFGATHAAASAEEARDIVFHLTNGVWADKAIITVGVMHEEVIQNAFNIIRKAGTVAMTAVGPRNTNINVSSGAAVGGMKKMQGVLAGNMNLHYDALRLIGLYRTGHLKLDELITRKYKLAEINQGYQDMMDGKNIRGIIVH